MSKSTTFRELLLAVLRDYKNDISVRDEISRINSVQPVSDEASLEEIEGMEFYLDDLKEGIRSNDYSLMEETANRYINDTFPGYKTPSLERSIVLREFMKAQTELVELVIRRCRGEYTNDEFVAYLPDHLGKLKKIDDGASPILPPRKPGRPNAIRDNIAPELQRRMDNDEIDTRNITRIALCQELARWHNSKHLRQVQADSIRKQLQSELDGIFKAAG